MIVILGGGLTGMSAAWHLSRLLPGEPRAILEQEPEPGGLCRSRTIQGFIFDATGHYLHLRDPLISAWVHQLMDGNLVEVERQSQIQIRGTRVDFPFQAHLYGLPPEVIARCLLDFIQASRAQVSGTEGKMPFDRWACQVFGEGIAREFLIPYNAKLYGCDPGELTAEWVAWSVPQPTLEQVVRGALGLKNAGMGYNPRFFYPRQGGIGALAAALAREVASDLRLNTKVVSIDAREKRLVVEGGEVLHWDRLISTVPLPYLLQRLRGLSGCPGLGLPLAEMAGQLRWSAVLDLELGVAREGVGGGAHWIYFPESDFPFYRVGFPSQVVPGLAPPGCSSLSVEFSRRPGAPVPPAETLLDLARPGLEEAGILEPADEVVLARVELIDPAYVIFDSRRTTLVEAARRRLLSGGVRIGGRYGEWGYSFMERALADGHDLARALAGEG